MTRRIAIATSRDGLWAALEEDNSIVALRPADGARASLVGAVYLGRIVGLRPDLPAALVEIGLDRPGFLSAEDILPKGALAKLHEGQAILVEIVKDARADKAAGLSMKLRRKVTPAADRTPPCRLDVSPPPEAAAIATWLEAPVDEIVLDQRRAYADFRAWLMQAHPELAERLSFSNEPLYESRGIGGALEEALSPRVELSGGGALIIEATALAVAIDVDAGGKGSPVPANVAAARAVARQIRLRNLSGPILVGFVGMNGKGDRGRVLAVLEKALKAAAPDCQVLGWTRLGHVELVRRRGAPSLGELIGQN